MGPGGFFPTNPDLAGILGRTDLDFDNFSFFILLDPEFPNFQVLRFPGPQKSGLGPGLGRGPGGPSAGPLGKT